MATIHDAQTAGMTAGMTTGSRREVPAEYARQEPLRDAWLDAYDAMAQALRGCVPAPRTASKSPRISRPTTKIVKAKTPEPPPPPARRMMMAILDEHERAQF